MRQPVSFPTLALRHYVKVSSAAIRTRHDYGLGPIFRVPTDDYWIT
jgi:hypothetical protein